MSNNKLSANTVVMLVQDRETAKEVVSQLLERFSSSNAKETWRSDAEFSKQSPSTELRRIVNNLLKNG